MYNEYDVIDRTMTNIYDVDVAADVNIDINNQWRIINDVTLKTGHLILLKSQDDTSENDIYIVNSDNYLENSDLLSTREKAYKFSCSVKMGKNADKQYFLNTGTTSTGGGFPIYYEPKTFVEGQSYLIKHLINYNIYNTFTGNTYSGATTSKMIFTDFDVARKQLSDNSGFYDEFSISVVIASIPSNFVTINYHNDSYSIRYGAISDYTYSGITTDIITTGNTTAIPYVSGFDVIAGDYVVIEMFSEPPSGYTLLTEETYDPCLGSGTTTILVTGTTNGQTITNLTMNSYVKSVDTVNNIFYLEEVIPNRVLSDLSLSNFNIENLSIANDWEDALDKLNNNPYSEFFDVSYSESSGIFYDIIIYPKESEFNQYFDYDALSFNLTDNNDLKNFDTSNQYIKYKLFDRLNQIDDSVFDTGFTFYNEYLLSDITGYRYIDSDTVKVYTDVEDLIDKFKPYTYVYVTDNSGVTSTTLVVGVNDYEIIIERPKDWIRYPVQRQEPPITSIQNIDGLKNISDILYKLYINDPNDNYWYYERSSNEIKYICKIYAELLTLNEDFRNNVTGIIYDNDNNEFVLKLYDIINDQNLFYTPIEVIFIGSDRITRLPVPFYLLGDVTTITTTIRGPIIPGVIPSTTTSTTLIPTTTTTTSTISPTTTTTTTLISSCELLCEVEYFADCVLDGYINCDYYTTTTTTMIPTTTTTTTNMGPISTTTTTTTTTIIPITTTTTTTILGSVYYGVSENAVVSESEVLLNFYTTSGEVGSLSGKKYTMDAGYYYKYWLIPDLPNEGSRVINKITNLENYVILAYTQYYRYYQENPFPDEQQSITYGKITINGIVYRIYRSITKSSLQLECYVYSID